MTRIVGGAATLLALLGLAACAGTGAPATGGLVAATDPPPSVVVPQSPASSPTEEPDVDSPDETDEASASPAATPAPTASPASAGDGITGTWTGVWQNDPHWGKATGGFTMTITQHGTDFDGPIDVTGPTCLRHGTSKGTVIGDHVSMGWIATGARDVHFDGVVHGGQMSGTWTAIACTADIEISGSWSAQRE